jgi:hypothetical protein
VSPTGGGAIYWILLDVRVVNVVGELLEVFAAASSRA